MNDRRRRFIKQARVQVEDAKSLIDTALEEEQECFDNLPEGIQCGERGNEMEENIEALQDASSSLEEALDYLEGIS